MFVWKRLPNQRVVQDPNHRRDSTSLLVRPQLFDRINSVNEMWTVLPHEVLVLPHEGFILSKKVPHW